MSWYLEVLRKYAVFEGRARRKEYWMFTLVNTLIMIVLVVADNRLATNDDFGILTAIYLLVVLIPSLAVGVRRLHDTGRSGWWLLFGIVPLIGGIVILVFTCQDSEAGRNEYGPNPKLAAA